MAPRYPVLFIPILIVCFIFFNVLLQLECRWKAHDPKLGTSTAVSHPPTLSIGSASIVAGQLTTTPGLAFVKS